MHQGGVGVQISSIPVLFQTPFQTKVTPVSNVFQTVPERIRLRAFHTLLNVHIRFKPVSNTVSNPVSNPSKTKGNIRNKTSQKGSEESEV